MSKGASKTRTLGHMHAINYSGKLPGMAADVIEQVRAQKVRQKL
jgi:hypothetical protein